MSCSRAAAARSWARRPFCPRAARPVFGGGRRCGRFPVPALLGHRNLPLDLTDSLGCQVEDTVVIEPASDFTLIAVVDSATCANSEDGLILLETQGGTGDAEFTFVGPFGAVPVGDSIADVGAGVYEITASMKPVVPRCCWFPWALRRLW